MTEYPDNTPELDSNHPVLAKLKADLDLATANYNRVNELANNYRAKLYTKTEELKTELIELIEESEITLSVAERIADVFDIVLTKQIEVEVEITATLTIELPVGTDPDEVGDNLIIDRLTFDTLYGDGEVLEQDYEITNVRVS